MPDIGIGALIEQTRHLGETIAIDVFETKEKISYAELARETDRIGNALLSLGIKVGDRIGVMMPNRLAYPLTWLAMMKIGAVHVPINTRYTADEVSYVAGDAGLSLAIVDPDCLSVFLDGAKNHLSKDRVLVAGSGRQDCESLDDLLKNAGTRNCAVAGVGPDSLANIQYTSGTTGFPKGCMLTQDYWMVLAHAARSWDAEKPRRLFSAQPYFYMDPQWITLKSIMNHGCLILAPGLSSSRYIGWLKTHRAEWCMFPLLMTRQPEKPDDRTTGLKQVATFGWSGDAAQSFEKRFGAIAREAFGMTEIGLGTYVPVFAKARAYEGSVGRAGPFREISVRDENGAPVKPDQTGELWVRGRSIFQGYWNRPTATQDAITADGWFRTGDLFRIDEDGFLWLVGRKKDMIRRSSENIAAREVEAVICALIEVEDAACVAVPDEVRGEEVKAYIHLKQGHTSASCPPDRIISHCEAHLAAFKVPRFVAFVAEFPRTASNKIAKAQLIEGCDDLRIGAYDRQAPDNPPAG